MTLNKIKTSREISFQERELYEIEQLKEKRLAIFKNLSDKQIQDIEYILSEFESKTFFYCGGIYQQLNSVLQKLMNDNNMRSKNYFDNYCSIKKQQIQFKDDLIHKKQQCSRQIQRLVVLRNKLVEMSNISEQLATKDVVNFLDKLNKNKTNIENNNLQEYQKLEENLLILNEQLNIKIHDFAATRLQNDSAKTQWLSTHISNLESTREILQQLTDQNTQLLTKIRDNRNESDSLRSVLAQTETVSDSIRRQHEQLYINMEEQMNKLHQQQLLEHVDIPESPAPSLQKSTHIEFETLFDLQFRIKEYEDQLEAIKNRTKLLSLQLTQGRVRQSQSEHAYEAATRQNQQDQVKANSKELYLYNELLNTIKFQEEQIKFLESLKSGSKRRHRIKEQNIQQTD
ncbi:Hypothetical_protein [Hexamita inflata]|uniref:Hypothetical_protein n=1 Tax=Hexamita inflata TaxID=28002 RepID=A0AA86PQB1_9EUKA|nr:Hypothetical protein HINF_LOCUS30416 [Hexamita inflata]